MANFELSIYLLLFTDDFHSNFIFLFCQCSLYLQFDEILWISLHMKTLSSMFFPLNLNTAEHRKSGEEEKTNSSVLGFLEVNVEEFSFFGWKGNESNSESDVGKYKIVLNRMDGLNSKRRCTN